MDMDDLVGDIAGEVTKGDKTKFGVILLFVIEQLIVVAIQWFFKKYTSDPSKAKAEFLDFFQNMNLLRKIQWTLKASKVIRQNKNFYVDGDEVVGATARRLGKLTADELESLFAKFTVQSTVGN